MKLTSAVLAGVLCLILFASPAFAASPSFSQDDHGGSVPLNLGLTGLITDAGSQQYGLYGGQLVSGMVNGQPVSPGPISFNLNAEVHGLTVGGRGSLNVDGFNAWITIDSAIPAAIFPLSSTGDNCDPTTGPCNSEIPLLFTGVAFINTGEGDSVQAPIGIESAYWDPLGGPIVITSLDPSVFNFTLVVTYDAATITWTGVQLQGEFQGTLGSESVAGLYNQMTFSQENLLKGTESDFGSIVFSGATDPSLNAGGFFFGHTTFTAAGGLDCSMAPFDFPLPEGTCLATGASSNGSFFMTGGQGTFIHGTYATIWSVPSLFTQTIVIASVT